jgi:hypothetical protein
MKPFKLYFENDFMNGVDELDKIQGALIWAFKRWKEVTEVLPCNRNPHTFASNSVNPHTWSGKVLKQASQKFGVNVNDLLKTLQANPKMVLESDQDFIAGLDDVDINFEEMVKKAYERWCYWKLLTPTSDQTKKDFLRHVIHYGLDPTPSFIRDALAVAVVGSGVTVDVLARWILQHQEVLNENDFMKGLTPLNKVICIYVL